MGSHKKMGLSEGDDFPKRADCGSLEEFQEKTKQCYEKLGLRLPDTFSEDEKRAIVEECTVKLIEPRVLSEKYNTTVFAIRHFVYEKGMKLPPEDLSRYPDFPKKSEEMSAEEYQDILKKYWKARKKRLHRENKKKEKTELRANDIRQFGHIPKGDFDENTEMNLSAISKLMDFPVRSQCMSGEEYAEKSKNYYQQPGLRILLGIKVKALNAGGGEKLSADLTRYPDFPLKKDNMPIEEFEEAINNYLKDKKMVKKLKKQKEKLKQQLKKQRRQKRKNTDWNLVMNY